MFTLDTSRIITKSITLVSNSEEADFLKTLLKQKINDDKGRDRGSVAMAKRRGDGALGGPLLHIDLRVAVEI